MRIDGQTFIENAKEIFSFLDGHGFQLVEAKPDETGIRFEDVLTYRSANLMLLVQRSSARGSVWCVLGGPGETYPQRALSLNQILAEVGVCAEPVEGDSLAQARAQAHLLWRYLPGLLCGDLTVLERIWARQDQEDCELAERQRQLARRIEVHGDLEILELPNVPEALGEDFLRRFPDHDLSAPYIWLVSSPLIELYSPTYEAALELAADFAKKI